MIETKNIGSNIRRIREFKGIHRRYIAQKLDIGVTAYGNIEREKTKYISDERLSIIASALNVDKRKLLSASSTFTVTNLNNLDNNPVLLQLSEIELTDLTFIFKQYQKAVIEITEINKTISQVLEYITSS